VPAKDSPEARVVYSLKQHLLAEGLRGGRVSEVIVDADGAWMNTSYERQWQVSDEMRCARHERIGLTGVYGFLGPAGKCVMFAGTKRWNDRKMVFAGDLSVLRFFCRPGFQVPLFARGRAFKFQNWPRKRRRPRYCRRRLSRFAP
jgi:hypothetical protein